MSWLARSLSSSLGSKATVAVTGLALLGFVLVHMLGNLQIFLGQEAINAYAAKLKSLSGPLWVARLGLLAIAFVHVVTAIRLAARSKAARPVAYVANGSVQKTVSARSMVITGLLILAFAVYHLAHFTWGVILTDTHQLMDASGRPDVFSMMVLGFQQPLIAGSYIAAMLLLALHIRHGTGSFFQTLGARPPRFAPIIEKTALGLAWIILIGNVSMPLAVLAGVISLPPGVGR